jgi:hypothetical protein
LSHYLCSAAQSKSTFWFLDQRKKSPSHLWNLTSALAMDRMPRSECDSFGWNSSSKGLPHTELPPLPVPEGSPPCKSVRVHQSVLRQCSTWSLITRPRARASRGYAEPKHMRSNRTHLHHKVLDYSMEPNAMVEPVGAQLHEILARFWHLHPSCTLLRPTRRSLHYY